MCCAVALLHDRCGDLCSCDSEGMNQSFLGGLLVTIVQLIKNYEINCLLIGPPSLASISKFLHALFQSLAARRETFRPNL